MKILKTVISLFLLLTYSIGFAHNLVPHCSTFSPHESHPPSHQHHNDLGEHDEDHVHVLHNSHIDEGVFDFVLCLATEAGDEENECIEEHCFTVNTNTVSLKKTAHLATAIVLFSITNEPVIATINNSLINEESLFYASPPISNTPLRGPPTS